MLLRAPFIHPSPGIRAAPRRATSNHADPNRLDQLKPTDHVG